MNKLILFAFAAILVNESCAQICKIEGSQCVYEGVTLSENFTLPNDEKYSSNITAVTFKSSNLPSIPSEIFLYFTNLEKLLLIEQKIKEIQPNVFKNAKTLKLLELKSNEIKILRNQTFEGAAELEIIRIPNNSIHQIEENAFKGLTKLKVIGLGDNKITEISENTFNQLKNLEVIGLAANKLQFLPKDLFQANLKLKFINLQDNQLNAVSQTMFSHLKVLKSLWIERNKCISGKWEQDAFENIAEIEGRLEKCSGNFNRTESEILRSKTIEKTNVPESTTNHTKIAANKASLTQIWSSGRFYCFAIIVLCIGYRDFY